MHDEIREALEIGLDLARAEAVALKLQYGDALQHKHTRAASDIATIEKALEVWQARAALLPQTQTPEGWIEEAMRLVDTYATACHNAAIAGYSSPDIWRAALEAHLRAPTNPAKG